MGIKKLTPTSPARRYQTYLTRDELTTSTPEKSLLEPKTRISGARARTGETKGSGPVHRTVPNLVRPGREQR